MIPIAGGWKDAALPAMVSYPGQDGAVPSTQQQFLPHSPVPIVDPWQALLRESQLSLPWPDESLLEKAV